jgi:YD repeat-containing protein
MLLPLILSLSERDGYFLLASIPIPAIIQLMQTSSQKFTYTPSDPNGNLIKKVDKATGKTTTYQYDAENQLISVISEQGSVISYKYDGLGRRIEKDVDGKITRYVYDNEDILLEYNYDPSAMS